MTYDPDDLREVHKHQPDPMRPAPPVRNSPSWMPWAVAAVIVLAATLLWSQMSGPATDPATTSSTTPTVTTEPAPVAPAPMTPAPPAVNQTAPATPPSGGTQ